MAEQVSPFDDEQNEVVQKRKAEERYKDNLFQNSSTLLDKFDGKVIQGEVAYRGLSRAAQVADAEEVLLIEHGLTPGLRTLEMASMYYLQRTLTDLGITFNSREEFIDQMTKTQDERIKTLITMRVKENIDAFQDEGARYRLFDDTDLKRYHELGTAFLI